MPAVSPPVPETTLIQRIAPDQVRHPILREAVAYWNRLRGTRAFPTREDLSPREMGTILHYVSLVKVVDGGADFVHRIVGDAMVRAFSVPIQNRSFTEIARDAPELIEASFPLFREVVATASPVAWRQHTGKDALHSAFADSEAVLLPLGRETVDHVLGFGVVETRAVTARL